MASRRQIEANQRNAKLSSGPISDEGKKRSRQNALKHGLTAETHILIEGEDEKEFQAFHDAIVLELKPKTAIECEYVRNIVGMFWRLRRIPLFEAALMAWVKQGVETDKAFGGITTPVESRPIQIMLYPEDIQDFDEKKCVTQYVEDDDAKTEDVENPQVKFGRVVRSLFNGDLTSKLSRHEASLQKRLSTALNELRDMQERRRSIEAKTIEVKADS